MKRRLVSILLCVAMALLPVCALAADDVNDRGTLGIYWTGSNYDVRGLAQGGEAANPTAIKTTYANGGYTTVLRHAGAMYGVRFTGANTPAAVSGIPHLSVKADYAFVSAGRYLQITYTLINDGDAAIAGLDLGAHADIMIGNDDYAGIYRTDTGFRMVNTSTSPTALGYNKQFNLVCKGGMGVVDVSTMWFGHYSGRENHVFEDTADAQLTGTDSGLAFSWKGMTVPARTVTDSSGAVETWQYAPGSAVRSLLFSVSEQGTPPAIPQNGRPRLYLTAAGEKKILVNAKVQDTAGLTDTLYYTVNGAAEYAIGSVVADGGEKTLAGYIDLTGAAPNDYALQMWIMNSRGVMSEVVEKTIRIHADNRIDEVTPDGVVALGVPGPGDNVVLPLSAPASPAWQASGSGISAAWNAVTGATHYYVQLYDGNGNECGEPLPVQGGTSLDCAAALGRHGGGSYTFTVMAASQNASSLPSVHSNTYIFTAPGASGGVLSAPLTQEKLDAVFGPGGATLVNGVVTLARSAVLNTPIQVETDVRLDLHGFTLTGPDGQSAITVVGSNTALSLVNSQSEVGAVIGGAGTQGGDGGAAIEADGGSVSVGANVTVQGGNGGNASDGNGGNGGNGVNATSAGVNVDGSVLGGNGGDGVNGGHGGSGGSGVSTGGSITNTGTVTGGDGGSGNGSGSGGTGGAGADAGGNVTNRSGSIVSGGDGGNGGASGNGGSGGAGANANGNIVNDTGSAVTGGRGGAGGNGGSGGNGGTGSSAGGSVSGGGATNGGAGGASGGGASGSAGESKREGTPEGTPGGASESASGSGGIGGDSNAYSASWEGNSLIVQANCDKLASVVVDGVQLKKDADYTVRCGSTSIAFTPAYLATLKDGVHGVCVRFSDGQYIGTFLTPLGAAVTAITAVAGVPDTGGMPLAWLLLLAAPGLAATVKRKREA